MPNIFYFTNVNIRYQVSCAKISFNANPKGQKNFMMKSLVLVLFSNTKTLSKYYVMELSTIQRNVTSISYQGVINHLLEDLLAALVAWHGRMDHAGGLELV